MLKYESYYMKKVNINGLKIAKSRSISRFKDNSPFAICKRIISYLIPLASSKIQNLSLQSICWREIISGYKWRLMIGTQSIYAIMWKIRWWFSFEVFNITMKSRWNNFNKIKLSCSNLRIAWFTQISWFSEAQHDSKRESVTSTSGKAKWQFTHSCKLAVLDFTDLKQIDEIFDKMRPKFWPLNVCFFKQSFLTCLSWLKPPNTYIWLWKEAVHDP